MRDDDARRNVEEQHRRNPEHDVGRAELAGRADPAQADDGENLDGGKIDDAQLFSERGALEFDMVRSSPEPSFVGPLGGFHARMLSPDELVAVDRMEHGNSSELKSAIEMEGSVRAAGQAIGEGVAVLSGVALLGCALAAGQPWLDRHFLPVYNVSRHTYVFWESLVRIGAAAIGLALVFVWRRRLGDFLARVTARRLAGDVGRIALAVVLALGASEVALRYMFTRATEEQSPREEPSRRPDARLGWTFVPARTSRDTYGGRVVEYAFDASGYRVEDASRPVDFDRPTVLFAGESMIVGHGLTWSESIPGQVEKLLATQTANLAVHGFANDQAYLRLAAELPRFRRPVAVVSLFMPTLFNRNLDDDRPHLGPGLVWLPPRHHWRLTALFRFFVPYRSDEQIARGIAVTQEVLRDTLRLANARGAVPLIVVPQFGAEVEAETMLRRRVLDEIGLPYVRIDIDPDWRLAWNRHPDPRAARAIAVAVAARLHQR